MFGSDFASFCITVLVGLCLVVFGLGVGLGLLLG